MAWIGCDNIWSPPLAALYDMSVIGYLWNIRGEDLRGSAKAVWSRVEPTVSGVEEYKKSRRRIIANEKTNLVRK
jgi:hypothetical protein